MSIVADRATFLDRFVEFAGTPVALIDACLAESEATHQSRLWTTMTADRRNLAVLYKAAELLSLSPGAKSLRMAKKDDATAIYTKRWEQLARGGYTPPKPVQMVVQDGGQGPIEPVSPHAGRGWKGARWCHRCEGRRPKEDQG